MIRAHPSWFIGFTMAEGSFGVKWKSYLSFFYSLGNTHEFNLLSAIQELLGFTYQMTPYQDYYQFQTTSVIGVQAIINFFTSNDHLPLVGYKADQFHKWCTDLKSLPRYSTIIIPIK